MAIRFVTGSKMDAVKIGNIFTHLIPHLFSILISLIQFSIGLHGHKQQLFASTFLSLKLRSSTITSDAITYTQTI